MISLRTFAVLSVLVAAMSTGWSMLTTGRPLPAARFQDWAVLQEEKSVDHILQVWRQPLAGLPRGAEGYAMLAYEARFMDSREIAVNTARGLLQKQRFSEYVGRGYTVEATPWNCREQLGTLFTIRGLDHGAKAPRAHRAMIYTLAFTREEWVIRMELRIATTSDELDTADRAMKHIEGPKLADEIGGLVLDSWELTRTHDTSSPIQPMVTAPPIPETPPAPPATDTTPPASPAPTPEAAPTPPIVPTTPSAPEAPATPEGAPRPEVAPTEAAPTPAPAPEGAPTPEVAPTTAPATPNTPDTPRPDAGASAPARETVPTSPPAALPATKDARWTTPDGYLSLALPPGWGVSGEAPYLISGLANTSIRLYPYETYARDEEVPQILQAFAAGQREVSSKHFTQSDVMLDGAAGIEVCYTNYSKRTSLLYLLGKSKRLWQIEIELPGEAAGIPESVTHLIQSLRIR